MNIGDVLSRSWRTVWKHKVLWLFGILASCGARSGGSGGGNSYSTDSSQGMTPPPELQRVFTNLERSFRSIPEEQVAIMVALIFGAICLLWIITWLVGLYGKTGVTVGALRAEAGTEVAFRPIWSQSWGIFDRVVGLNLLLAIPPFLVGGLFIAALVVLGIATMGIGLLCLLPLFCIAIPLGIAYAVYTDMANLAVVTEGMGISAAIQRGWEVLSKNAGSIVILALILGVGGFVVSLVLAIPFFLALLPILIGAASGDAMQNLTISLICLVAAIPVTVVVGGILQSYLQTAWTLAYSEMTAAK